MPSQASTNDQLERAIDLCNGAGLYDAADWINARLNRERADFADCRRCEREAFDRLGPGETMFGGRMHVCRRCSDKRCPQAADHRLPCKYNG